MIRRARLGLWITPLFALLVLTVACLLEWLFDVPAWVYWIIIPFTVFAWFGDLITIAFGRSRPTQHATRPGQ
jgi:hypothetical protein